MRRGVGLGRVGSRFWALGISSKKSDMDKMEVKQRQNPVVEAFGQELTRLRQSRHEAHVEHRPHSSCEGYSH